jgi:hypothetical protein
MWMTAVPVVCPVGSQLVMVDSLYVQSEASLYVQPEASWASPLAGAFCMQGGYGLPFDEFPTSSQSSPKKLQHQVDCQKFFQKFHSPAAAVEKHQANTKEIEAESSKCIDNVSETSTDHGYADCDKFAFDGDTSCPTSFSSSCPTSFSSSDVRSAVSDKFDSFKFSHDDAGIRDADDAGFCDAGILDQGFSVSIKNTFVDISPTSMKKRSDGRLSKSLPPPNRIERFVHNEMMPSLSTKIRTHSTSYSAELS